MFFVIDVRTGSSTCSGSPRIPRPNGPWQAARHFTWALTGPPGQVRSLIRDRAGQFTNTCDVVFAAEGIQVLRTAPQCPRMNAIADRWIVSARRECLDRMLITGEPDLRWSLMTISITMTRTSRTGHCLRARPAGVRIRLI